MSPVENCNVPETTAQYIASCQDFGFSRIRFVFHAHASGFGITL